MTTAPRDRFGGTKTRKLQLRATGLRIAEMSDLCQRLRRSSTVNDDIYALRSEAADEIDRLNAELVDKAKAWDAIAEKNGEIERFRAELAAANERTQMNIDQADSHFKKMEAAGHAIEAELRDVRAQLAASQELCTKFEAAVGEDVGEILKLRTQLTGARKVTDRMCEIALEADAVSRIQGFSYEKRHVIRDVWLEPGKQEIWSAPVAGSDEYQAFQKQCRIERMRKVLEEVFALTDDQGTT